MTDGVGSDPFVPLPNTHHPGFECHTAVSCRALLGKVAFVELVSGRGLLIVDPAGEIEVSSMPYKRVTMHPVSFARPAPYVGRPFVYLWQGWIDDVGRWITGDALMVHHPQMPEEQREWPDYWHYKALPERG